MGDVIKLKTNKPPYKVICCANCGGDLWRIIPNEDDNGVSIKAVVCANRGCESMVMANTVKTDQILDAPTPSPLGDR